jgi:protein-S-isoprenylcysteine O-methyltransferase Ste14
MLLTDWLSGAGLLLWIGYEILLRRRADADAADWHGGQEDRRSTPLLMGAYLSAVVLLIVLGEAGVGILPEPARWIGVGLLALGLAVRAWGMRVLGRFYTRTLRVVGDQHVVQGGPYKVIRHPGYTGSILVWTGYCLGLGNWIAFVVVAVLMLVAYTWRISSEERMLVAHFGQEYLDYQGRTARLIPFVY